eukprot:7380144-Prymnesium_polylepis.1
MNLVNGAVQLDARGGHSEVEQVDHSSKSTIRAQQPDGPSRASRASWSSPSYGEDRDDDYWPQARDVLHRTTIELISAHNTPKVNARPHALPQPSGCCALQETRAPRARC